MVRTDLQKTRTIGNTASISLFFAALVLPFMFFLFALSIDVTKYFRETQQAQKALDDAALHAYKFMPYPAQAEQAARDYLLHTAGFNQGLAADTQDDALTLAITARAKLGFARFFISDGTLPINLVSRVRGTPFDSLMVVDSSSYLTPGLEEEAWGSPGNWPAAEFFAGGYGYQCLKPGGGEIDARNLTQLCFNPAFSSLKLAAIRAYEYLSGFQLNAVGVGFFPGTGGAFFDEVRPLQLGHSSVPGWGEAVFKNYLRYCGSSEYCAAAAEQEVQHSPYKFPASSALIPAGWQPPPGVPPAMVLPPDWRFNPDYEPYFRVSQAIWSRVAVQDLPRTDELLLEIWLRIMPPFFAERGGLKGRAEKTAIVFAGDVPRLESLRFEQAGDAVSGALGAKFEEFRGVLSENPDLTFRLFYVLLQHEQGFSDLGQRFSNLEEFFEAESALGAEELGGRFEVRALMASDPDILARQVAGHVVLQKKSAVLSW